jgi:hypothetical protein
MYKLNSQNQHGNTVLHVLMGVVVVAVIVFVGWRIAERHKNTSVAVTSPVSSTTAATAATATPLAAGTNNSSLSSDLSNINGSLTQSSQDSSSANSAINDQQNEIVVPTN